jgi:regulation of enolase protein 1 (concanavalin A-like superfamily)
MLKTRIAWETGTWTTQPVATARDGDDLLVTAAEGSDFWQRTLYGFQHESGHALLAPWDRQRAIEVSFRIDTFTELYDQAGLMLRVDADRWIKTGIEFNDGVPHVGAVVTDQYSDWSLAPVPEWTGAVVTVRASYADDAVTLRARASGTPWRTIRVAPFRHANAALAGPFTCAPTRANLQVRFTSWTATAPDVALHTDPPTS